MKVVPKLRAYKKELDCRFSEPINGKSVFIYFMLFIYVPVVVRQLRLLADLMFRTLQMSRRNRRPAPEIDRKHFASFSWRKDPAIP